MVSFPKKSFYSYLEVLDLLAMTDKELKTHCRNGLDSLFSDNGKKIFLREDIIALYATGDNLKEPQAEFDFLTHNQSDKKQNHDHSQSNPDELHLLKDHRQSIKSALNLIAQIKSKHPQIWCSH